MKTARLARTNSIDTQHHNCGSFATTKDRPKNQLQLVGSATNSDEVETVSLVSSNDDLEEANNIHCRHPSVIYDSTINPNSYKYRLHSCQQNHHHQQHQSSPVAAACDDANTNARGMFVGVAEVVSAANSSSFAAADPMSAAASFPSVSDADGCVAGEGSDTDDDCVVIENDDSDDKNDDNDYNVPYQQTSKVCIPVLHRTSEVKLTISDRYVLVIFNIFYQSFAERKASFFGLPT